MILKRLAAGLALAALCAGPGALAQKPGAQDAQTLNVQVVKTASIKYLLYLPKDYGKDTTVKWPLMLFLHGSGERGSDLDKVKAHGPPKLIAQGKDFPFIILSPQCPDGSWWTTDTLNALLDTTIKNYSVDEDRVYLTGLSMGGFGTYALAAEHPEKFAAIAPICGGGYFRNARRLKNVPVWAFHGGKDPTVPIAENQGMVDAIKAAGGDAKITIYPEAGHDSWTQTYDNPELYTWLLAHKRVAASK